MLLEVNLSIVNFCNAHCVFCPERPDVPREFMPLELVERLAAEMASPEFKDSNGSPILHSWIGENGEATLHPRFIEVIRILKKAGHPVGLFTNASGLTEERSRIIVEEGLIDSINVNIDGLGPETYRIMKGLDYDRMERNLKTFLAIRGDGPPRIVIHALTAYSYQSRVREWFGQDPGRLPAGKYNPEEGEQIETKWRPLIGKNGYIDLSGCFFWAERAYTEKKPGVWECRNIERVRTNAFIASNGDWYACCFDAENKLVLGNLYESSLMEIYNGEKMRMLLERLGNRRFDEIGGPCNRVDCCQVI